MSETAINLDNVSKSFSLGNGASLEVLKSVSLTVNKSETVAIMGPSGCGKSTLLNILGTLDTADSGVLMVDSQEVDVTNEAQVADLRSQKLGFVFQKHHLMPQLTALENVLLPTIKKPQANAGERALSLLEKVGLSDRQSHRPGQMSGGECQRVALCRALINSPTVLLADEPTGALDESSAEQMSELLLKLNQENGLTIIVVTHSQDLASKMKKTYKLVNGVLS